MPAYPGLDMNFIAAMKNRAAAKKPWTPGTGAPPPAAAAAVPPAAAAAQGVSNPWSGQEQANYYTQLAHGLGSYTSGRADIEAQGVQQAASASEQMRQQLIQFGIVPEGFKDTYGWVNDETRQLAKQNTDSGVSTFARLQKAYKDASSRAQKLRAARGMARSGETGHQLNEGNLLHRQNLSDATGKLLDANRGIYDQYTTGFAQRAAALRQLETDSYNSVRDQAMPERPGAPATAAPAGAPAPVVPNYNPSTAVSNLFRWDQEQGL